MKLVNVTREDALFICQNLREQDRLEINATSWDEDAESIADRFMAVADGAWTVLSGDTPVAVGGAHCVWPGVWNIWLVGTDRFNECKIGMTRFAKKVMIPTLKARGAHRIQCHTLDSHSDSHAWLEALGARRESTAFGYGKNKETFYCYVWDFR